VTRYFVNLHNQAGSCVNVHHRCVSCAGLTCRESNAIIVIVLGESDIVRTDLNTRPGFYFYGFYFYPRKRIGCPAPGGERVR